MKMCVFLSREREQIHIDRQTKHNLNNDNFYEKTKQSRKTQLYNLTKTGRNFSHWNIEKTRRKEAYDKVIF